MKKLITKFTSIFLAVVVLMSCFVIPVSATETGLLMFFGSVPLDVKSNFFIDNKLISDKMFFIYRQRYNDYCFVNFLNSDCTELVMSNNSSRTVYFKKSDNSYATSDLAVLYFNADGSYRSYFSNKNTAQEVGINGVEVSNNDIDLYVDSIIFSSFPVKFNENVIYSPSSNRNFCIKDFFETRLDDEILDKDWALGQIVSSAPLTPIAGDPTFNGFKQWLIDNQKYKELVKFGINCGADNLSSLVDLWTTHYSSLSDFTNALTETFLNVNAISQVSNVWNWFAQQFELYKQSLVTYEQFKFKDDIFNDTSDYDTNGNFISSETAYLKLILNVLNSFRNDFNNSFSSLINYVATINTNIVNLINNFQIFSSINNNLRLIYNKMSDVSNDINTNFNQNMTAIANAEANVVDTLLSIDFSSDNVSCNYNEQNLFDKLEYLFIPQPIPAEYELLNVMSNKFYFVGDVRKIASSIYDLDVSNDYLIDSNDTLDNVLSCDYRDSISADYNVNTASLVNSSAKQDDNLFKINLKSDYLNIKSDKYVSFFDFSIFNEYKKYINVFIVSICYIAYFRRLYARMPDFLRTGVYRAGQGDDKN